ncbi:hypothetical protein [Thermococcus sp. MAR1]|uniref:hypothetical protein n=1 Tax=Thermococcus sp. MAR1 TaxID=1638263 RepID=UPI00143CA39C|nr:hypothetical protein [Thermococcus sp. MAR1]NJE09489.1 hypothetical protein [Thermococcus sp. MAR1]
MKKMLLAMVVLLVAGLLLARGYIGPGLENSSIEGSYPPQETVATSSSVQSITSTETSETTPKETVPTGAMLFHADVLHVIVSPDIEYPHAAVITYANDSEVFLLAVPDESYISEKNYIDVSALYIDASWISSIGIIESGGAWYQDPYSFSGEHGFEIATKNGYKMYHVRAGNWEEVPQVEDVKEFYNYLTGIFDLGLSHETVIYEVEYSPEKGEFISFEDLKEEKVWRGKVISITQELRVEKYYHLDYGTSEKHYGMTGYYFSMEIAPVLTGLALNMASDDPDGNSYVLAVPMVYEGLITLHFTQNGEPDGISVDIKNVPEGTKFYVTYVKSGKFE